MSFIESLGKGFIRSAVNQVGRDGGRVISNNVFGDAHATPVRRVGAVCGYAASGTNIPEEGLTDLQLRSWALEHGYRLTARRSSSLKSVLFMAIHAIFPLYYGGVIFGAAALRRLFLLFFGKSWFAKKLSKYEQVADRRYKYGSRTVANGTELDVVEVEAQPIERLIHIPRLLLYTAIAVGNIWYSSEMWSKSESEAEPTQPETTELVVDN